MDYVNTTPHFQYISRLRKTPPTEYVVTEINYVQSMSQYIQKSQELGHSAKIITLNTAEMMEIAIDCEHRRIEKLNKYRPNNMPTIPFDETNVRNILDYKMSEELQYGYAVTFASKVSKDMFKLLVPIFSANAAHCNNASKSIMFSM